MGLTRYTTRYTTSVSTCPAPVARAAPRMPIFGQGPSPKMSRGSSTRLASEPHSMAAMAVLMRPTA